MRSLCSVTSGTFENPGTPGVKYDRRDAGDGISWTGAPLKKTPRHRGRGEGSGGNAEGKNHAGAWDGPCRDSAGRGV